MGKLSMTVACVGLSASLLAGSAEAMKKVKPNKRHVKATDKGFVHRVDAADTPHFLLNREATQGFFVKGTGAQVVKKATHYLIEGICARLLHLHPASVKKGAAHLTEAERTHMVLSAISAHLKKGVPGDGSDVMVRSFAKPHRGQGLPWAEELVVGTIHLQDGSFASVVHPTSTKGGMAQGAFRFGMSWPAAQKLFAGARLSLEPSQNPPVEDFYVIEGLHAQTTRTADHHVLKAGKFYASDGQQLIKDWFSHQDRDLSLERPRLDLSTMVMPKN